MIPSNRQYLPAYCDPSAFLPGTQEARLLFRERPFLFEDFVGRAIRFLQSDEVRKMGFRYDPAATLPCKWKCSDESVFGVDLCLYAYTGQYPFDKGRIGGRFNEVSVGAAVHHAPINIDFGGSHVGYGSGPEGGRFGRIRRPLHTHESSTDCGALMALIEPFKRVYDDAADNILAFTADEGRALVSIPNEFIQPGWSSGTIKLLVDLEALTAGSVAYDPVQTHTHTVAGRSLFRLHPKFTYALSPEVQAQLLRTTPTPIGRELTAEFFSIFDTSAELDRDGLPRERLLPYMARILTSREAPYPLKAAVINTNIEYNRLTDCLRHEDYLPYSFASFTGVFLDLYDDEVGYLNLFQPVGLTIKPAGRTREVEIPPTGIHEIFAKLDPASPVLPLRGVLGYDRAKAERVLDSFSFRPGHFAVDHG